MSWQDCSWSGLHMGAKFEKSFPYGVFEFTMAVEEHLGAYAQCSLFSPMFQFATQADALATAQSALDALLIGERPPNLNLSQRNFLRGELGWMRLSDGCWQNQHCFISSRWPVSQNIGPIAGSESGFDSFKAAVK